MCLISSLITLLMLCAISLENLDAKTVPRSKYKSVEPGSPVINLIKAKLFVTQKKIESRVNKQKQKTETKLLTNPWAKAIRQKQIPRANTKKRGYVNENTIAQTIGWVPKTADPSWFLHAWGHTFHDVWHDTRMNQKFEPKPKMTKEKFIDMNYLRNQTLSTVCIGKSSVYNIPRQTYYSQKSFHVQKLHDRIFWNVLRRQIYIYARSEECHTTKYTHWLTYQECALRRNQRVEYLIPKYPLFQRGYHYQYKKYITY